MKGKKYIKKYAKWLRKRNMKKKKLDLETGMKAGMKVEWWSLETKQGFCVVPACINTGSTTSDKLLHGKYSAWTSWIVTWIGL